MKPWLLTAFLALLAAPALAAPAQAQAPAPQLAPAPSGAELSRMKAAMDAYNRMPDTQGDGPYGALKAEDPAFPGHVVYRPADLSRLGDRKLPILLWGSGGCSDDGASQRLFLEEAASHGFLVVAPGSIKSGPGAPPARPEPPSPNLIARTTAAQVWQGLDQAIAADRGPGPLHGRIDEERVAVAGYSCGGLQALQLADRPQVKALVILHSGIFGPNTPKMGGISVDKSMLAGLHTPVLYLLGGPRDIAYANGADDVARIDRTPVFFANHDVGHGGTFNQPNGGEEAKVMLKWLDWQLFGDAQAGRTFTGADCGLCRDPTWTVQRKGF